MCRGAGAFDETVMFQKLNPTPLEDIPDFKAYASGFKWQPLQLEAMIALFVPQNSRPVMYVLGTASLPAVFTRVMN